MHIKITAVALGLIGLVGCGTTSSSSGTVVTQGGLDSATVGFDDRDESCLDSVPEQALNADLVTIDETGQSYHEMVACGMLAFELSSSVSNVFVTALLDAQGLEVPGGFVWDGDGHYVSGSNGTDMVVSYYYGDDIEGGAEDELIRLNLFELDNYLRGVSTTLDVAAQELVVSWNHTGPLVELMGEGANPPNPMRIGLDDLVLPYELGRIKTVTEIEVLHNQPQATVTYTLASKQRRLNPLLGTAQMDFDLIGSQTIGANGAVLTTTSWGVGYNNVAGVLDGDVDFELEGADVDLNGTFRFEETSYAEIFWTCSPRE